MENRTLVTTEGLAELIGRPVGDAEFIAALERRSGRTLAPARRGRKPKHDPEDK